MGRKMAGRRATREAKHHVRANFVVQGLSRAGSSLTLEVFARGQKIGEIILGQGSLYWYGRNRRSRKRIRWSEFATMMDTLAYGARKE